MKKLILMLLICLSLLATNIYAMPPAILSGGSANVAGIEKIGGIVVGAIQAVGVIVAVTVLIYVGIRFMLAAPSEKANIKGMAIPYIVGALIVFATTSLVNVIYDLAKAISA